MRECGLSIIFPSGPVKQLYGADITPAWLDHVRLSTIRLTNCTASFVSPEGLILTNHHCVESCLAELSSKDKSLVELGYRGGRPRHGTAMSRAARGRAGRQRERDRYGFQGHRRIERCCGQRCPQKNAHHARTGLRTGERQVAYRQTAMSSSNAVSGRPVFSLQVQALRRPSAGVRAGGRHRCIRRRSGQFSVSALVARFLDSPGLRER